MIDRFEGYMMMQSRIWRNDDWAVTNVYIGVIR